MEKATPIFLSPCSYQKTYLIVPGLQLGTLILRIQLTFGLTTVYKIYTIIYSVVEYDLFDNNEDSCYVPCFKKNSNITGFQKRGYVNELRLKQVIHES